MSSAAVMIGALRVNLHFFFFYQIYPKNVQLNVHIFFLLFFSQHPSVHLSRLLRTTVTSIMNFDQFWWYFTQLTRGDCWCVLRKVLIIWFPNKEVMWFNHFPTSVLYLYLPLDAICTAIQFKIIQNSTTVKNMKLILPITINVISLNHYPI